MVSPVFTRLIPWNTKLGFVANPGVAVHGARTYHTSDGIDYAPLHFNITSIFHRALQRQNRQSHGQAILVRVSLSRKSQDTRRSISLDPAHFCLFGHCPSTKSRSILRMGLPVAAKPSPPRTVQFLNSQQSQNP